MINKIMHIYSTLKLNLCDSINMIDLLQNNLKHFVGIRYIYNTLKLNLRDSINMIDLLKNNMKHFLFGTSLAHHEPPYKPAGQVRLLYFLLQFICYLSYPTAAICDGVRLGYVSIFENLKQFKRFIFVCPTNRHVRREQRTGAHPADRRRRSRVTFESTVNVTINRNSSPGKGLCQFTLCHVVTLPY